MKQLDGKKVYQKAIKTTKKIKVNEAVVGLGKALTEMRKNNKIKIDDETFNTIITYYSLMLLARTHDTKEYNEIFNSCLVGNDDKESEA